MVWARCRVELADLLVELEVTLRRTEAAIVAVVDEADRRQVFTGDGHASVRGWAGATVRWSPVELRDRVRCAHLGRDLPAALAGLADGTVGVAQVRELARARANPRAGGQLAAAGDVLLDHARNLPYEAFKTVVRRWEALADADGAHRSHEAAHAGRRAHIADLDDTFHLDARFGAAQGSAIREILDQFTQAEFAAEWDDLTARYGDAATPSMMERTAAQRRADAVAAIFERAAAASPADRSPEPVVNILIDEASWLAALQRSLGGDDVTMPDAATVADRRCQTVDGTLLDPADVVAAAVVGHVRRMVVNAAGVVIDLGRTSRCFTGSARTAALLQGVHCIYPGCWNRHCQIDHSVDWAHLGSTNPANAGPLCPRHNRWKTRGYRTWRDPDGRWHTYRPDGTELRAA